jgi:hypothetical protein
MVEKPLDEADLPQLRQQSALLAFYLGSLDITRQRMRTRVHRMKAVAARDASLCDEETIAD